MRGLEARPFVARLAQFKVLAGTLVVALVLVLVGQWGSIPAFASTSSITSVSPTGASTTGGGTITITGVGFGTGTPAVSIGGTPATGVALVSDTTITATIPAGSAGLADVVVTPAGGSPLTLSSGFEYSAPVLTPVFDTIAPGVGPTTGGDPVTISGANLDRVTDIKFGSVWIPSWQFVNLGSGGSSITVIAPYGAVGAVDITLKASNSTEVTKYGAYQYVLPAIAGISPASGPSTGGTAVAITGSGFGSSGSVSVTIGGVAATNVVRVDSARITATTSAAAVGTANVVVTVSGVSGAPGPITITGSQLFTFAPAVATPTLSAITPNSGPVAGGSTVTVTGTNFRASNGSLATITFGGVSGTVQSVSANGKSMTVTVPAHAAGGVDVQVSTIDGRATMRNGYTYNASPTISGVSPASGIVQGGSLVTLSGSGFGSSGIPTVTVGGRSAMCVTRMNDSTITFVTPAGTSTGARDIEVTPATRGGSATLPGGFTYVTATTFPTVSSVSPSNGLTSGGTAITITGSGFSSAAAPSVLIGGACALGVTVVNATTITATTPTGVAGARDVVITTATGTVTAAGAFTFEDAPAILALSPAAGPTTGGTVVVITGRGFGTEGTPVVTIGGVAVTSVQLLSSTQIRITTPPGAAGAQAVQVTPSGGSTLNKPNAYTYQAPTISSISPFAGPTRGGTPVTIWGTGFGESGTPTVTFGGAPATSVVRVSSTQLTAVTPAGAEGYVSVTVTPTTGPASGTRGNAFSYVTDVVAPTVNTSLPSRGPTEGGITVYVSGVNFIGSDDVPATVKVGSAAGTNVAVSPSGNSLTFRAPALPPGSYDVTVTTKDGSAVLRWAYSVSGPPVIDGCNAVSPREISPNAGQSVTVLGEGFGTAGTPSVTVGGISATVTASTDTSVTFTAPAGDLGYPQIVVRPTTGGSPITISGCLFRTTDLWITAPTHAIDFGDPSPVFQSTATGLHGDDALQSVVHVFSGGGYGPTTAVPTKAGTYTVTPANAVLSPGTLSYYDVHYVQSTFTIRGLVATVYAQDAVKMYGEDDPDFTSTAVGLTDGHTLTGVGYVFSGRNLTSYGPSTTPPTNVGEYWITPQSALVGGTEENYQFTYVSANYTITQRPITVGAVPSFKVYGNPDPEFDWQIEAGSLAYDDTLYGTLTRESGEDVGEYDILRGSLNNSNYSITYDSDILEITPRPIALTARDAEKVYGDSDPELIVDADGLIPGDYLEGFLLREVGENVGTYEIARGSVTAGSNYQVTSFTGGQFTITPRPIQVTIDDKNRIYGNPDPALTYTITSGNLVFGDQLTGAAVRDLGEDVGDYPIRVGSLAAGDNYALTVIDGTLTIDPRPLGITADDKTKHFGDPDPSPFTYSITSGALVGGDALTGALGRESGEDVGEYDITAGTLNGGPNYEVTVIGGTLDITPRPITVTADDTTRVYGDGDPELTWQVTVGALVDGAELSGSLDRDPGEDVGPYSITQGSLDNESYDITFVAGTLSITPRPITVRAQPDSKEFGDTDPVLTATSDDLVFGDTLTGAVTRESGEDVGSFAITAGTIGAGSNYTVASFESATFQITPRAIELTAGDRSSTYGEALPANGVTLTSGSLAPGDSLGAASFAFDPATPADVGSYAITPSEVEFAAGSASNYTVAYVSGTLVISPLAITVTPDATTKDYGDVDPPLTYSVSPALIGDDEFTGALSRNAGEDVGSYAITQGTLSAGGNYDLTLAEAELDIVIRTIEITAAPQSKTYGDADPELTWSITEGSLLEGDSLSGSLARADGENVGVYAISQGTLANDNYIIEFVGADLEITQRSIHVTVGDASKEYGEVDPELTAVSDDLVFGDTLTGSPVRDDGDDVGTYPIRIGAVSAGSNYVIGSVTEGEFEITTRSLEITAGAASMTYGDPVPSLTYSITSGALIDGDVLTSATTSVEGTPTDAGSYTISVSDAVITGGAANYSITYVPGTLTVDPLEITVTANAATKQYGDIDPPLTWAAEPDLLGGDEFSGAISRVAGEDVGAHAITQGDLSAGGNYSIAFVPADLTITVRTLEITANPATKVYGDADPVITWTITEGSLLGEDALTGSLSRVEGEDVGVYGITIGSLDNANYVVEFVSDDFTITPRPISIDIADSSKRFGDSDPTLTATSDDLVFDDELSGSPERESGEDVGAYEIGVGSLSAGDNYATPTYDAGSFAITARSIEVTAGSTTITYGDSLPAVGGTVTDGELVGDDALGAVTTTFDPATPVDVGSYPITATGAVITNGSAGNYSITFLPGTLTIDPFEVTVTAEPASKQYGNADPVLGWTASPGLLGGDEFTGSLSRESGEDVGAYEITIGTLTAGSNYAITLDSDELEITPREITVTALAASKTYGNSDPTFAWSITTGSLVDGDALAGALGRESGEDVGEYDITLGTLGDSNYDIDFVSAVFEITPRDITVFAVHKNRQYGAADPDLEAISDDLIGDDELTGEPTRAPGTAVDLYPITQGTVSAGPNYRIVTFEEGTFTITPRVIEVTSDDKSITYGDPEPTLTYSITDGSLVGDDAFSGALTRAGGTDAGGYAITQGTLALGDNYSLTVVPGTLTITPRVIGITADDVSKVYGAADPTPLSYTVTSGELADEGDITGALVREPGEDVGEYDILPGTLDAGSNYSFTVEGGTFTITARPIEVRADNTTAVFGNPDPEFTWSVTDGMLVGDDVLGGELSRDAGSDVGDYAIRLGTLGDENYSIDFVGAVHEITPRPVTIVGDDVVVTYGASDPVLSATVTGLVGDDILGGAPTREPGTDAGEYAVLQGTLSAGSNYEITGYTPGTFTIQPRPITVTISDASRVYGETDPEFAFSVTTGELVGDDEISGAPEREVGDDVGEYAISQGSLSVGSNYSLLVTPGAFEITPKEAQVEVGSGYSSFGEPRPEFTLTPSGLIDGDSITSSELTFDGSSTVPTLPGVITVGVDVTGTESGPASNYDFTVVPGTWVIDGPYAVAIDPPSGLTIGGLPFEIRGSGFGFEAPVVSFDGVPATEVTLLDSGTIIGLTPEHAEGLVTVTVETAAGTVELTDAYTYVLPVPGPSIYSLAPGRGPVDGGTSFTVTGEHLRGTDGEPAVVLIDGTPATDVVVAEDGLSLVAVSPAGAVGPRDVDVYTTDGGVTFLLGFEYYTGPAGDVSGSVWLDRDSDGIWDEGEPPLVGTTVYLSPVVPVSGATPAASLVATAVSDADGRFLFENIPYGSWMLSFENPGGLTLTGASSTTVQVPITVDSPEVELDLPLIGHSSIEEAIVRYSDGTPVPGATVLVRWAGPDGLFGTDDDLVITLTADEDGQFSVFGLPSGSYYVSGYDEAGATFGPTPVTLLPEGVLADSIFEIELEDTTPGGEDPDGEPGGEPETSALAATGLDIGHLGLTAVLLLLLGAVVVGRANRGGRTLP